MVVHYSPRLMDLELNDAKVNFIIYAFILHCGTKTAEKKPRRAYYFRNRYVCFFLIIHMRFYVLVCVY